MRVGEMESIYRRWGKAAFDIALSAMALTILFPMIVIIAILIWMSLGRPILFRQLRPGLNERPFELIKFRTMRTAAPEEIWYRSDEKRLSRFGRLIRKYSLDELPTLWNVLRSEMSLVGPRPLLLDYLPKYTIEQKRRHDVLPGITGWAQINGRQRISFSQRLKLDVWYVDNQSLSLDIKIIFHTVVAIFCAADVVPGQNVDDIDDLGLSPDREVQPIIKEGQ